MYQIDIQYELINLRHSSDIPTFNAANDDKMFTTKRSSNETIHGSDKETVPKNPKIRALLDEIINDSSPSSTISQANPQNAPVIQKKVPKPPPEIIAEVFPFESPDKVILKPSPEVVAAVFQEKEQPEELAVESTPPGTKGDIIGFSDTEDTDDESTDDESIDVTDIQPNVKFLPAKVEGLRKRFHELYTEFTRQKKHEHRNEVVFLLDELLRQQGIDSEE